MSAPVRVWGDDDATMFVSEIGDVAIRLRFYVGDEPCHVVQKWTGDDWDRIVAAVAEARRGAP